METYFSNMTVDERSQEQLLQDLHRLVSDAEKLLHKAGKEMSEGSKAQLKDTLAKAREKARKLETVLLSSARTTDRIMREYPYQTIGVAFGVGVLIGVLVNRR